MLQVETIKKLRTAKGFSFAEAARAAKLSGPQHWQRIEAGRSPDPSISTVARMARVLGVRLDSLWPQK